jgi:hypothetical protein
VLIAAIEIGQEELQIADLLDTVLEHEPPSTPGLKMGTTADGRVVVITEADRAMHQFIIGATGTGKSTLPLNQIAADMRAGEGMLVLDPHGDLWEAARRLVPPAREQDLVLAHVGDAQHPFTMNVLGRTRRRPRN